MSVDRTLVEVIKARAAEGLCRTCGWPVDADLNCPFCGRTNPITNREAAPDLSEPRAASQNGEHNRD